MKYIVKLFCLLSSSLLLLSCESQYKGRLKVYRTHYSKYNWYSCAIKHNNKFYQIDNLLVYDNGKLTEYQGCASEGLYTIKYKTESIVDNYRIRDKTYGNFSDLDIIKNKKTISFCNELYKIDQQNGDSIFAKSGVDNEYFVFVGNIPEQIK